MTLFSHKRSFEFAPAKPIMAMIGLLCGLLGFSLWTMVQEANGIDARRATVAVAAAVFAHAENLSQIAYTEASSPEGFKALYGASINVAAFQKIWGEPTREARRYDAMFTLTSEGRVGFGFERGAQSSASYRELFGNALSALLKSSKEKKSRASTGLVQTRRGLAIISVARIVGATAEQQAIKTAKGTAYLVFAKFLTPALLKTIGEDQWIYGLRTGHPTSDEISTVLKDAAGDPVITLSWRPFHPGRAALMDSLPWLLAGVLLFLIAAVFLLRQGLHMLSELNSSAMTDSLSQLPNRRALHRDIEAKLSEDEPLVLAFIDLDGFKAVNDNYGHHTGDQLINRCAEALATIFKENATVYRLGGDEFAIIISGKNADQQAETCCQELLDQMAQPFQIDARKISIGASIGLAMNKNGLMQPSELLRQADVAMYAAKSAGKMRFEWFNHSFDERKTHRNKTELALRRALQQDQFHLEYQPLVDAEGRYVVSLEALLRWTRSDGTMVSPAEFIPIAEESGLINVIGRWVLERACTDALFWDDVQLAVNISAAQLRNPEFPAELAQILHVTGFPASRLELEVTETYLVIDPVLASRTLEGIRKLGVKIALDDFGTGYASIGFLRKFQFDKLKIDRSLVVEAATNPASRTLLQASVAIARALDMKVTAEGIENRAQADLARIAGCNQLQGWLYFKAMRAEIIDEHLKPIEMLSQAQAKAA
jgi:diguanylate cyclase (GGDEF)-like protein